MSASDPRADLASRLCLACGMCCDGTLFRLTRVEADERPRLMRLGFAIITRAGNEVGFTQPCVALARDKRCGQYAGRPETCRAFECRVLVGLKAGEVGLDEALAEVAEAQRLVVELGRVLPADGDEETRSIAMRGRTWAKSGGPAMPETAAAQAALERYLDGQFRRPGRGG